MTASPECGNHTSKWRRGISLERCGDISKILDMRHDSYSKPSCELFSSKQRPRSTASRLAKKCFMKNLFSQQETRLTVMKS